jgi:hypothetical protein
VLLHIIVSIGLFFVLSLDLDAAIAKIVEDFHLEFDLLLDV